MPIYYPDGDGGRITLTGAEGSEYSLPTASTSVKGGVVVGEGLAMEGDRLNVTLTSGGGSNYSLPTASAFVKGGVKIGNGLAMEGDRLHVTLTSGGGEDSGGGCCGCGGNMYFAGIFPTLPENVPYGWVAFESNTPYVYDGEEWLPFCCAEPDTVTPQGGCSCPVIGDGLEFEDENVQGGWHKIGAGLVLSNNTLNANNYYRVRYNANFLSDIGRWSGGLTVPPYYEQGDVFVELQGSHAFWVIEGSRTGAGLSLRDMDDPVVRMTSYASGSEPRYIGDIYDDAARNSHRLVVGGSGADFSSSSYEDIRIEVPTGVIRDDDSPGFDAGEDGGYFHKEADGKLYYTRQFNRGETFLVGTTDSVYKGDDGKLYYRLGSTGEVFLIGTPTGIVG